MDDFCERQKALLDLEKQAEAQQLQQKLAEQTGHQCQLEGISLLNLNVVSLHTSLFGKLSLQLANHKNQQLAKSQFKVGDEVVLYNPKHKNTKDHEELNCIVSKISSHTIDIVHSDDQEGSGQDVGAIFNAIMNLRLDLTSSEATHKKMMAALEGMQQHKYTDNVLTDLLFNNPNSQGNYWKHRLITPNPARHASVASSIVNRALNESQIRAINTSLDSNFVSIIHGPPGTGKTSTVVELIIQAIKDSGSSSSGGGKKLLVCAPSNVAVDNILDRLLAALADSKGSGIRPVRIGHPARVSERLIAHCLDSLVASHEGTEIAMDVRREIDAILKTSYKNKTRDFSARRLQRQELGVLRKEVRRREERVVASVISSCNVVLCTCVGAASRILRDVKFDVAIIDEAAQALEVSCWIPILKACKVVLAGDHKQLAPTVKSAEAARGGLATTLFERIISHNGGLFDDCIVMLDTQYRMNQKISSWASVSSYNGGLKTADSCKDISIVDYPFPLATPNNAMSLPVLLLLNTAHCEEGGEEDSGEGSHSNRYEAALLSRHVSYLLSCGIRPKDIGIITPYNGQLELLRSLIFGSDDGSDTGRNLRLEGLEIRTVDGFQGGEKEVVILSLVRSNKRKEVGFLADERRINVAVTRAKRNLTVVCDVDTVQSNVFIAGLVRHIIRFGSARNICEYRDVFDDTLDNDTFADSYRELLDPSYDDWVEENGDIDAIGTQGKNSRGEMRDGRGSSVREKSKTAKQKQVSGTGKDVANATKVAAKKAVEEVANNIFTANFKSFLGECECKLSPNHEIVYNIETKSFHFDSSSQGSNSGVFTFPAYLSANERRLIHEVCDERGVNHRSRNSDSGRATERFLEVSFRPFPEGGRNNNVCIKIPTTDAGSIVEVADKATAEYVAAESSSESDDTASVEQGQDSNKKASKKKSKKNANTGLASSNNKNRSTAAPPALDEMDEMALLEAEIRRNAELRASSKYRLGSISIPSYEKKVMNDRLHDKIAASQAQRRADSSGLVGGGTKKKKVAKRPEKPMLTLAELRERRLQKLDPSNSNSSNNV